MQRAAAIITVLFCFSLSSLAQVLGTMEVETVQEAERGPWINTDPERAVLVVYTDITGMNFATNNREIIKVDSPQSGVFLVSLYLALIS